MKKLSEYKEIRGYKIKSVIGKGQYGEVVHAQNGAKIDFAIKAIPLEKCSVDKDLMMFYEIETSTLLQLTHPNIIEFIESFTFENYFCIIYEYCDNGSVKQKLNEFG